MNLPQKANNRIGSHEIGRPSGHAVEIGDCVRGDSGCITAVAHLGELRLEITDART
jgi:hypothetical protein